MYAQILSIIAPILLISGLGYFWSLFKLAYHEKFVTSFVMNIGMPSLILSAIIKTGLPATDLLYLTKITLLGLLLFFAFNAVFLKLYKKDFRTYIGPLSFTNTANMGIPVCMLASRCSHCWRPKSPLCHANGAGFLRHAIGIFDCAAGLVDSL